MVQFRKQGLPQEEYVFFFIDLFGESVQRHPAKPWVQGDADDNTAKEAFKVSQLLMPGFFRALPLLSCAVWIIGAGPPKIRGLSPPLSELGVGSLWMHH